MKNFAEEDIGKRMLEIELLDVDKYYDDKNKLNITALRIKILEISPSIVLISICFSESLDLRFALEREGIFPHLRLKGDLRLTTNGKKIQLDEVQVKLLDTMADEKNIEKTTHCVPSSTNPDSISELASSRRHQNPPDFDLEL